jgi:hypothetical protein
LGFSPQDLDVILTKTKPFLIRVADENGKSLGDATIIPKYLVESEKGDEWIEADTFMADSGGNAELYLDSSKRYEFLVYYDDPTTRHLDYMPLLFDNEGRGYEPQSINFELHSTKLYKIRVVDEKGYPLPNSYVLPHYRDLDRWKYSWGFYADENGVAEVFLDPTRIYAFSVSCDIPTTSQIDYEAQWFDNEGNGYEPKDLEFSLQKSQLFSITVTDESQNPIQKARITLYASFHNYFTKRENWKRIRVYYTDNEGKVTIWANEKSRYAFDVYHYDSNTAELDYVPVWVDNKSLGHKPPLDLKIILTKSENYKIRVVDDNGNPLEGIQISPIPYSSQAFLQYSITDKNGYANLKLNPREKYKFYISGDSKDTPGVDYLPYFIDNFGRGFDPPMLQEEFSELYSYGVKEVWEDYSLIAKQAGTIEFPIYTEENIDIGDFLKYIEMFYTDPKLESKDIKFDLKVEPFFGGYIVKIVLPVTQERYGIRIYYPLSKQAFDTEDNYLLNGKGVGFSLTKGVKINPLDKDLQFDILIVRAREAWNKNERLQTLVYLNDAKILANTPNKMKQVNDLFQQLEEGEGEEREPLKHYLMISLLILAFLQLGVLFAKLLINRRLV